MNNILNAQEAFAALQKGKTVLCRYAGNGTLPGDKEFMTLDQVPATVFYQPHYEFCIKIETIELAGVTFTKPLTIDEYQDGQDVFAICTYQRSIYVLNYKTSGLVESINNGFVQRDAENAELQLKAISKALGREFNGEVTVTRLGKESSKSKRKKEPEPVIKATNDDNSLDDIIGPVAAQSPTSNQKLDDDTSDKNSKNREWTRFHNDKPYLDLGNKSQYEIEYADLSAVVIHAQSSDEANSVVEKTHHWTTEQRNPLLSLISKRLCELQEQSKVQPKEPPSLMVQIQNAPDLTTLDALEIDVSARHPDIQPRLMGYVKKRRFELEQIENAANDGGHSS